MLFFPKQAPTAEQTEKLATRESTVDTKKAIRLTLLPPGRNNPDGDDEPDEQNPNDPNDMVDLKVCT